MPSVYFIIIQFYNIKKGTKKKAPGIYK